jgi:hypothetical protein
MWTRLSDEEERQVFPLVGDVSQKWYSDAILSDYGKSCESEMAGEAIVAMMANWPDGWRGSQKRSDGGFWTSTRH